MAQALRRFWVSLKRYALPNIVWTFWVNAWLTLKKRQVGRWYKSKSWKSWFSVPLSQWTREYFFEIWGEIVFTFRTNVMWCNYWGRFDNRSRKFSWNLNEINHFFSHTGDTTHCSFITLGTIIFFFLDQFFQKRLYLWQFELDS